MKRRIQSMLCAVASAACMLVPVMANAGAAQEVKTWSNIFTGISAEFEAGHYGTGQWGTDPSRIVCQSWVACQDGTNGSMDIAYSVRKATTDIGRYKASKQHVNNPLINTYKYYGWYY